MKLLLLAAVGRGREHHEALLGVGRESAQKVIPLLLLLRGSLGPGACVGLVHDHKLGSLLHEHVAAVGGFDVVDADDLVGVVVVDARVALDLAVEPGLRARTDDHGLDVELVADLLLPLVAEVRQADDGEPPDAAPLHEFAGEQQRLDRLTDAHVVGDQEADGLLPERHHERHDLVGPRAERELGEGPKGAGAIAEGKPGGVVEQPGRGDVAQIGGLGRRKPGVAGGVVLDTEGEVDACRLVVGAAQRLHDEEIGVVGRQHDPVAAAKADEFAGLEVGGHARGNPCVASADLGKDVGAPAHECG